MPFHSQKHFFPVFQLENIQVRTNIDWDTFFFKVIPENAKPDFSFQTIVPLFLHIYYRLPVIRFLITVENIFQMNETNNEKHDSLTQDNGLNDEVIKYGGTARKLFYLFFFSWVQTSVSHKILNPEKF